MVYASCTRRTHWTTARYSRHGVHQPLFHLHSRPTGCEQRMDYGPVACQRRRSSQVGRSRHAVASRHFTNNAGRVRHYPGYPRTFGSLSQ